MVSQALFLFRLPIHFKQITVICFASISISGRFVKLHDRDRPKYFLLGASRAPSKEKSRRPQEISGV